MNDEYYEEEEMDVAPRRKRRVVTDEAPAPRPDADDDDAVEETTSRRPAKASNGIRSGWTAGQKVADASSPFAQGFRLSNVPQIVKFLEDAPYASYSRHWVKRGQTNRPYTCLGSVGKECPLCSVDPRPQATAAFNIAVVDEDGTVSLKTWDVGPRIFNTLKNFALNSKGGGLDYGYYAVSKVGSGQQSQTTIIPVRESLLEEDYGVVPPTEADLEAMAPYTADIIEIPSVKEMREIASEMASGDDY